MHPMQVTKLILRTAIKFALIAGLVYVADYLIGNNHGNWVSWASLIGAGALLWNLFRDLK